jgi:hypothetical protein
VESWYRIYSIEAGSGTRINCLNFFAYEVLTTHSGIRATVHTAKPATPTKSRSVSSATPRSAASWSGVSRPCRLDPPLSRIAVRPLPRQQACDGSRRQRASRRPWRRPITAHDRKRSLSRGSCCDSYLAYVRVPRRQFIDAADRMPVGDLPNCGSALTGDVDERLLRDPLPGQYRLWRHGRSRVRDHSGCHRRRARAAQRQLGGGARPLGCRERSQESRRRWTS